MEQSERQREIINAALSLISDQGLQDLTMKRIAGLVGVSEPAIYRHFPSKADILSAIVDEMTVSRTNALNAARKQGYGAEKTLITFFEAHAQEFIRRPAMTTILFSEDLFRHDASLMARISDIILETQKMIQNEISKGQSDRVFSPDVDSVNVALMLLGGFRLLVSKWRFEQHSFDLLVYTSSFIRSALVLLK